MLIKSIKLVAFFILSYKHSFKKCFTFIKFKLIIKLALKRRIAMRIKVNYIKSNYEPAFYWFKAHKRYASAANWKEVEYDS